MIVVAHSDVNNLFLQIWMKNEMMSGMSDDVFVHVAQWNSDLPLHVALLMRVVMTDAAVGVWMDLVRVEEGQ